MTYWRMLCKTVQQKTNRSNLDKSTNVMWEMFYILVYSLVHFVTCQGSLDDVVSRVNLPKDTDRLVYRFQNKTHIFIGFDVVNDDVIYTMCWRTKGKKDILEDQNRNRRGFDRVKAGQVREFLSKDHLLAATDKHQQKRLKDSLRSCRRHGRTSKTCLMEAFAANAENMKNVKIAHSRSRTRRKS